MAGDGVRYDAGPQPAGRPPAPGTLALVQAFLNTHFDEASRGEVLTTPQALDRWLAARGLTDGRHPPRAADLRRMLAVREGLRALALANNGEPLDAASVAAMHDAARGAVVAVRIDPTGPHFLPRRPADVHAAMGMLLATVARAMVDGSWHRFKACPGRHCGWAFFDHSRNQSARWCSMQVCGDREKARAYYLRKRGGAMPPP